MVVTTTAGLTVTAWHLANAEARRITESVGGVSITGLQLTAFRVGDAERRAPSATCLARRRSVLYLAGPVRRCLETAD